MGARARLSRNGVEGYLDESAGSRRDQHNIFVQTVNAGLNAKWLDRGRQSKNGQQVP